MDTTITPSLQKKIIFRLEAESEADLKILIAIMTQNPNVKLLDSSYTQHGVRLAHRQIAFELEPIPY